MVELLAMPVTADVPLPCIRPVMVPTPMPPRATARVPVQPTVMDDARSKEVAGVPPNVRVTFVSSVFVSAAPATSAPAIAAQAGAADTVPVPVRDRYCFADVVLPASFASALVALL